MVCEDTLRIRNFPKDLSNDEKEDFLRHFGACQVKIITSNVKQKSTVFAKFSSKELAKSVMLRLHQMLVLDSRLCVEYADHDIGQSYVKIQKVESNDNNSKKHFKAFINKLNAWNSSVSFYQPPPSHLKYVYPKPNRATINNIAHALASVPKFYTQVLHLMNKMNLPPPFSNVPDPPQVALRHPLHQPFITTVKSKIQGLETEIANQESSSESEIESDPDRTDNCNVAVPVKRKLPQKKAIKRQKFIKPITQPQTVIRNINKTEDIFERVDLQLQRKIEVNVASDSLEQKATTVEENTPQIIGSFGVKSPVSETVNEDVQETREEEQKLSSIITEEELASNRIPSKDLGVLPVFKNYHPGASTCRLYIKNIAKTVELEDLEFIYKRYIDKNKDDNSKTQFDIRLMQEGRMKGQAFVTLDNVELAQKALKETNGFILKDKPLVVVFARSAVPKK